jgi:hypothetical protein
MTLLLVFLYYVSSIVFGPMAIHGGENPNQTRNIWKKYNVDAIPVREELRLRPRSNCFHAIKNNGCQTGRRVDSRNPFVVQI